MRRVGDYLRGSVVALEEDVAPRVPDEVVSRCLLSQVPPELGPFCLLISGQEVWIDPRVTQGCHQLRSFMDFWNGTVEYPESRDLTIAGSTGPFGLRCSLLLLEWYSP